MAKRTSKIILLKEDESSFSFAADFGAESSIVESVGVMATDFMPEESTIQVNEDGGYLVQNLSDAEAKKVEKDGRVEAVIDDIDVFALDDDFDYGALEGDAEDRDFFSLGEFSDEASAFGDVEGAYYESVNGEGIDPLDLEPDDAEDDFEALDPETMPFDTADSEPMPTQEISAFSPKVQQVMQCVIRCIIKEFGIKDDISDEKLKSLFDAEGISASPEMIAAVRRTIILWNIKLVHAPAAWRCHVKGKGVRVAVIDTGVGPNPLIRPKGGVSFVPGVASWRDDNGHGTHVAGTIGGLPASRLFGRRRIWYSVAPRCSIYAVKVLDKKGRGQLSWILNGLTWCLRNKMQVLNMSLGSSANTNDPRVYNMAYERIGRRLRKAGAILLAAAGNSNSFVGNPARCPSFVAVAAVNRRCRKAPFSCFGPQVELSAPGVRIRSLRPGRGFSLKSGTSMACPHVAGVAALVKSRHPGWSGDRIRARMDRTATDLGRPGRDPYYGYGLVNAGRATR